MRQGPEYSQWIDKDLGDRTQLRPPMELEHGFSQFLYVMWTDNGDGTYTLRPFNDLGTPA